jgi:hypothetical protein
LKDDPKTYMLPERKLMQGTSGTQSSRSTRSGKPLSARAIQQFTPKQEQALKILARAISMSGQRFSLVLVRLNDPERSLQWLQALENAYSISPQVLQVAQEETGLFSALRRLSSASRAVVVLGLESIQNSEEFWISTNQMRNEFPRKFPFPVVLVVDDTTLQQLIKLAPDFYSWASAPISFD